MWLPLYNLVVIALTLAYQAPLQALWNGRWHAGDQVPPQALIPGPEPLCAHHPQVLHRS